MYLTYELSAEQIRSRIATSILQRPTGRLTKPWMDEVIDAAARRGVPIPTKASIIEIPDPAPATWVEVEAILEAFKDKFGSYPDVLLLDSADDIAFRGKFEKRYEGLLDTYVYLRHLAKEKNFAIWSTGQLNRESVEKARINLKQIGDAFPRAQKSHYVLGLSQTTQERLDINGPDMNVYVLKDGAWLDVPRTDFWPHCALPFTSFKQRGIPRACTARIYTGGTNMARLSVIIKRKFAFCLNHELSRIWMLLIRRGSHGR
jgi:hypothetical protein